MSEGFRPFIEGLVRAKVSMTEESIFIQDDVKARYGAEDDYVIISDFCDNVYVPYPVLEKIMDAAREAHFRRNNERLKED